MQNYKAKHTEMIHGASHGEGRNVVDVGEQMCLCILSISLFSDERLLGFGFFFLN